MERRRVEKLHAPSDFLTSDVSGVNRVASPALLTPTHFTVSTPAPPLAPPIAPPALPPFPRQVGAPDTGPCGLHAGVAGQLGWSCPPLPPGADPWVVIAHTQQELLELRRENQRLLLQHGERQDQKDKEQRLKEELGELESKMRRHYGEHEAVCAKLSRCKAELEQTKEKLTKFQEECVLQHEDWDRELQNSKEETRQLQLATQKQMQLLREGHSAEVSALTQTNTDLQNTLHAVTQEVTSLRRQAEEVTSERDALKEQLRTLSSNLVEQTETLQKLRSYIGTHAHTGEEQLLYIQKLQKEKESLCLSVELLNVRVKSANDILALQEREIGDQCDPPHQDCRASRLLSLWRQKVFVLLVQLRCGDSQLCTERRQLLHTVSDLQQEIQKCQSQIGVLQHNLQDKTAQLGLQNIHTQELQQQLCSAMEENERLKQQKETSEKSLRDLTETAHRVGVCVEQWESQTETVQCDMKTLTQRLSFASKRLDTVHGLLLRREALRKAQEAIKPTETAVSDSSIKRLQSEVALLSSERDKLTQELKRTPDLIHNALRDLQQQLDREVGLLTQALSRSREELEVCERRCSEAQTQCEEQERTITELRAEALSAQQHSQRVLQERVSEMESLCDKQLREMEAQLNTARREHTKAVVALRQVERTTEREREAEREAERLRSEHTHRQITQLHTQLKEKDKDHNVLLAVVQQQGLMNEYKRLRRAAIHTSRTMLEEQQHKQQQHKQQHKQQQWQPGDAEQQEGCILGVLGEVRSLSSAVMLGSEEEEDEEGQGDDLRHRSTHTAKD
ncbi:coiled-coil alpha-helical rod protein 1 [Brachyhypopomus gauderio]|uniref:coiled-coil alpha-helical rod protein 1 n=1 Tax=Brachyhypopomus gauderio TaxID=698409 RepID=UPI004042AD50